MRQGDSYVWREGGGWRGLCVLWGSGPCWVDDGVWCGRATGSLRCFQPQETDQRISCLFPQVPVRLPTTFPQLFIPFPPPFSVSLCLLVRFALSGCVLSQSVSNILSHILSLCVSVSLSHCLCLCLFSSSTSTRGIYRLEQGSHQIIGNMDGGTLRQEWQGKGMDGWKDRDGWGDGCMGG